MAIEKSETTTPCPQGIQYSLLDLFLYFLAITILISGYTTAFSGTVSENVFWIIILILPIIVGGFLYLTGSLTRRRLHYPCLPPVTRFILIMILMIFGLILGYLVWSYKRAFYGEFLVIRPLGWPYPDKPLMELNNWYDYKYPAGPGMMKLHSEQLRVMLTLEILIGSVIAPVTWGLALLVPFRPEWLRILLFICKYPLHRNR
jgi:hypothetical protein